MHVVTADSAPAGCPECGTVSRSVKGKSVTAPKDLRCGEDPIQPGLTQDPLALPSAPVSARVVHRVHRRGTRRQADDGPVTTGDRRRGGDAARSVAEVSDPFGASRPTAPQAFHFGWTAAKRLNREKVSLSILRNPVRVFQLRV